ncbi:MAG: ComEC/Rec2 family competence protein, partial [Gammaproteobacteria bacterium]
MRLRVSAFFCGVWAMLLFRDLPDTAIFTILFLVSLPVGLRYPNARVLVWFVLGLWWATYRAHGMLAGALEVTLENEPIRIRGVIVGLPQAREKSTRFLFDIESVHGLRKDWPSPGRVRLSWYVDPPALIPGQRWELMVKLKRPRGFRNPGGFDYERWMFQQRLRATGYVLQSSRNQPLGDAAGQIIERMRFQLAWGLDHYLGRHPEAGLIKALALGVTDGITQPQWQVLSLTGTTHLVAISGLHVSLAAGLIFFLARRLWSLTGYGVLYLPAPRFAALAAMAGATVYAVLAGFSVPTQRALAMLAVVLLGGGLWGWRLGWRDTLLAALFAVLILDPFSTMFPGFWLSFGGVAVIALALAHRHGENVFLWQLSKTQFLVALGLAPMLVVFFGQNPMLGPLGNLVAVPWVSFLIVPMLLVAVVLWVPFPTAAHVLVDLATHALSWLLPFLESLATLQFATWKHPAAG